MSPFFLAPKKDWNIDQSVKPNRRQRLLGDTGFKEIIARICSEAKLVHVRGPEHGKEGGKIGLHRWSITLQADPTTIDLWHNSRGGYRAQYYISPDNGETANAYAVERLTTLTASIIEADKQRRRYWARASVSVCHSYARVWIHQGLWYRRAKLVDRLLRVQQWSAGINDDAKSTDRKLRGMLIPEHEAKIKIIGQWLVDADHASTTPPKEARARHINGCGFT